MAIIFGFHTVLDTVEKTGFLEGDKLFIARNSADGRVQKLTTKANRAHVPVTRMHYGELQTLTGTKNHQGIVLERTAGISIKTFTKQDFILATEGIYLALDGIKDPQNLGAICRSALALGVRGIFLPQKDSAPTGASALKASAGALTQMPFCYTGSIASLMQYISEKNPDVVMVALDKSGELFSDKDTSLVAKDRATLLVVGSEEGLSRLALERATHRRRLRIGSKVESYNVSVATALALYLLTPNS